MGIGDIIIHAVVVTYNPDLNVLRCQFGRIANQVEKIWLVDNASIQSLNNWIIDFELKEKLGFIPMPSNMGLGAAQNVGIQHALSAGATHVLILDQDSQPLPDMVSRLLNKLIQIQSSGVLVAVVAPVYEDKKTGARSGFVRLGWFDYKKQFVSAEQEPVEADFVISSGSLIPVSALEVIGLIDEDLFIDHVDTEWCLRARSKGYKLFGVPSARMFHSLGEKRKRIWFLRWRNVPYHSPFRYYYMLRNGILLQRRSYIPMKWRIGEMMRSMQMILFFGFWGKGSFKRLSMMLRGVWDGLKGVTGPM